MKRINVVVEGQTEESFVSEVLYDFFQRQNIYIKPICLWTRPKGKGVSGKGGIVSYEKIRTQIKKLCLEDRGVWVTTMIDLYGLPPEFPGVSSLTLEDPMLQTAHLERAFAQDIDCENFDANLILHEYEGLLFSDVHALALMLDNRQETFEKLQKDRDSFPTPEHINNSWETKPSRRIEKAYPQFQKTLHGILTALEIGLDTLRHECPHFNEWLLRLAALPIR